MRFETANRATVRRFILGYDASMLLKPLIAIVLILMDLMVLALLVLQWTTSRQFDVNILLFTLGLNILGAFLMRAAQSDE